MAERSSSSTNASRGTSRGRTPASSASDTSRAQPHTPRPSDTISSQGRSQTSSESSQPETRGIVGKVREQTNNRLSSQKDRALDSLTGVTQAVRQTTQQLRDNQHDTIARYIEQATSQIDRISQTLREKDAGELLEDAQRLARRQPALFVGSAFALGLIGARFFKSSPPDQYRSEYGHSEYRNSATYGTSGTSVPGRGF